MLSNDNARRITGAADANAVSSPASRGDTFARTRGGDFAAERGQADGDMSSDVRGGASDPYAASLRGERGGNAESGTHSDRSPTPYPRDSGADRAVGELRVRVTTARGALPVCGAHVFVARCGEGGVSAACVTDESGLSRLFRLPTESAAGAHIGEAPPCARYDIEVLADGFEPATFCSVPVYEGVTSIQCAEMIPRPAGGAMRE